MLFNGQGRPLNPDSWSSTLPASMGGNRTPIIDENHLYDYGESWVEKYHSDLMSGKDINILQVPKSLRRLTIDEAKIIQTFPQAVHKFKALIKLCFVDLCTVSTRPTTTTKIILIK